MTEVARLQAGTVYFAALSPNGAFLALARGPDLTLWNIPTGHEVSFPAHAQPIDAVAFAPDDRTAATLSVDGMAKLWHAAPGQELGSLDATGFEARTAAFSPDGQTLVAGDRYGALRFWRAATLAEADARRSRR
jgi:WD40 repeat protein